MSTRYKAFISYSHADNRQPGRKWAEWLHRSLETYAVPTELIGQQNQYGEPIPERIYPVFLDEKELSAHASLSSSLTKALRNSEFLIFLSSPRSAQSVYVQEEILFFKRQGRNERIISLIIDGEPAHGRASSDMQCFPDVLRFAVDEQGNLDYSQEEEPLAADVRLPQSDAQGFTSLDDYRHTLEQGHIPSREIKERLDAYKNRLELARLKIISTILGVSLGELTQRDQAYQLEQAKRKNRLIKRIAFAISLLALAAIGAGLFAWEQKNEAQRNFGQSLYTTALTRYGQQDYEDSAAYLAAAIRQNNANAATFGESLLATGQSQRIALTDMQAFNIAFSSDSQYLAGFVDLGYGKINLEVWQVYLEKRILSLADIAGPIEQSRSWFDSQNRLYYGKKNGQIVRTDVADKKTDVFYQGDPQKPAQLLAVSSEGIWLALALDHAVRLQNTVDSAKSIEQPAPPDRQKDHVLFSADERYALLIQQRPSATSFKRIALTGQGDQQEVLSTELDAQTMEFALSPAADKLLAETESGWKVWNMTTNIWFDLHYDGTPYSKIFFADEGRTLIALLYDSFDRYDAATGLLLERGHPLDPQITELWKNKLSEQPTPGFDKRIIQENEKVYLTNNAYNKLLVEEVILPDSSKQVVGKLAENGVLSSLIFLSQDGKNLSEYSLNQRCTRRLLHFEQQVDSFQLLHNDTVLTKCENTVQFFDLRTGRAFGEALTLMPGTRYRLSQDEHKIMVQEAANRFTIRNIADSSKFFSRQLDTAEKAVFLLSPDFTKLLQVQRQHWQLVDLTQPDSMHMQGEENLTNGRFSPDNKWLAIASEHEEVRLIDLKKEKIRKVLPAIKIPTLVFSPDSRKLLVSASQTELQLWDTDKLTPSGQRINQSSDSSFLEFSQDSRFLFLRSTYKESLVPSVLVFDTDKANLASIPFATGAYIDTILYEKAQRLLTIQRRPGQLFAQIWLLPFHLNATPQLADSLESYYQRKYDAGSAATLSLPETAPIHNWYFESRYNYTLTPGSPRTVSEQIASLLPAEAPFQVQQLQSMYLYHPLARAALSEYYSKSQETEFVARKLAEITRLQLRYITDNKLKNRCEVLLTKAQTRWSH